MLCYFCAQPLADNDDIDQHHPDKENYPEWVEPSHTKCHSQYHSKKGHFKKWGALSPYRGLPGLRLAVAAWPGFHRMGGLARAKSAQRDKRGRFISAQAQNTKG